MSGCLVGAMCCVFTAESHLFFFLFFFFNDTATTEIYTLSLHDALPISGPAPGRPRSWRLVPRQRCPGLVMKSTSAGNARDPSFAITRGRRAWIAISAAPPDPGNRTVGCA